MNVSLLITYIMSIISLAIISISPFNENINLLTYDLVTSLKSKDKQKREEIPVTIIGITEEDIQELGWPINDSILCNSIEILFNQGASTVGLDLYRDISIGPNNDCLKRKVLKYKNLISVSNISGNIKAIKGTPNNQQAFNDLVLDADRVIRRDLIHVGDQDENIKSLPLRLIEKHMKRESIYKEVESFKKSTWLKSTSGGYTALDSSGYQTMMSFDGIPNYKIWRLKELIENKIPLNNINGKIILIGSTAKSLKDNFEIPHSRLIKGKSYYEVPGVVIHSIRINSIIHLLNNNRPQISAIDNKYQSFIFIFIIFISIVIGERTKEIKKGLMLSIASTTLFIIVYIILLINNIWIAITMPLVSHLLITCSGLLRRGIINQIQKNEMNKLLGQTTSPKIAKELWSNRNSILKEGRFKSREIFVTVLFCDICNFTSISEKLSCSELIDWLNQIIKICVEEIITRNGIINKFTGDGLFAVYGAPLSNNSKEDSHNALNSVLAIKERIKVLNSEFENKNKPTVKLRIGINSGYVITGSIGNDKRLEYAIIGDTVNSASRLESIDSSIQKSCVRLLISGQTKKLLGTKFNKDNWIKWNRDNLKGKEISLNIYELKDN